MNKQNVMFVSCLLFGVFSGIVYITIFNSSTNTSVVQKAPSPMTNESTELSSVEVIPFALTDANNISISAVLNGNDHLDLMFHTAVDSISLTSDAVAKLQSFKMSQTANIESWGGKAELGVSTGNRLQIGNLQWNDQTIFVDHFSGPSTDGKFGPNLFAGKIIEIHFDTGELRIHHSLPTDITQANSKYQRLNITENQGCMYLAGQLVVEDSRLDHTFMLHSGFGGTVLLNDDFVQKHELASKLETISERELKDALGNVIKTKKVRLQSIAIGDCSLADLPIEIFDGRLGNQKVSVLGGDIIKRFNIVIDRDNHHLYLAKR